jgi:energy-coupling factor transporter transmembrane protein EcfT
MYIEMQKSKLIKNVLPSVRLIFLIVFLTSLIIAKSIYLLLFITTFFLIIAIISERKVKVYVKFLKDIFLILIIIIAICIIVFKEYNVINLFYIVYKTLLACLLIKTFEINTDFEELHESIYSLMIPLNGINIHQISLDIALSIYFIKYILLSGIEIKQIQTISAKTTFNLKNYIIPKFIFASNKTEKLKTNLELTFYKANYRRYNYKSKLLLTVLIAFFIICVFKEVIL